jgi:hypothetical protein
LRATGILPTSPTSLPLLLLLQLLLRVLRLLRLLVLGLRLRQHLLFFNPLPR